MEGAFRGAPGEVSAGGLGDRRCRCPHCDGPMVFSAEAAGMGITCPHCGEPMNLTEDDGEWGGAGVEGMPELEGRPGAADLAGAFRGRVMRESPGFGYRCAVWLGMVTVVAIPGVYALLVVMLGWGLWVMGVDWYEGMRRVDAGGW